MEGARGPMERCKALDLPTMRSAFKECWGQEGFCPGGVWRDREICKGPRWDPAGALDFSQVDRPPQQHFYLDISDMCLKMKKMVSLGGPEELLHISDVSRPGVCNTSCNVHHMVELQGAVAPTLAWGKGIICRNSPHSLACLPSRHAYCTSQHERCP